MSGRRTDAPIVAQRQTRSMWSVIYDGSVSDVVRDPLEWILCGSPGPQFDSTTSKPWLGATRLIWGRGFRGRRYLLLELALSRKEANKGEQ